MDRKSVEASHAANRAALKSALERFRPPWIPAGTPTSALYGVRIPTADRDHIKRLAVALAGDTKEAGDTTEAVEFAAWCLAQWKEFNRLTALLASPDEMAAPTGAGAETSRPDRPGLTANVKRLKDKKSTRS